MDALNRESRWQRGSTKIRVRITPLDLKLLFLLLQYRYLSTSAIAAFLEDDADKKWIQERLGQLYRAGYVERPPTQREFFNSNYRDLIYELDTLGERALKEHGMWDDEAAVAWLSRGRHGRTMFPHSVMVCEALAHFAVPLQRANKRMHLRFIPWSEIKANMPPDVRKAKDVHSLPVEIEYEIDGKLHRSEKRLTPDAVFGIDYGDQLTRFFAIEADRGNEPLRRDNLNQTSIMRKVLQYKAAFNSRAYKTRWGLPNLFTTFITIPDGEDGKKRMRDMQALTEELIGPSKFFVFNTMASFGGFNPPEGYDDGRLIVREWDRPGHPPLDIGSPD